MRTAARVSSSNALFNDWLERCAADLAMLSTRTPHGPLPVRRRARGSAPSSAATGSSTALQTLWVEPADRARRAGLPGRPPGGPDATRRTTPSRARSCTRRGSGEMAATRRGPVRAATTAAVDATPLFVMLAGALLARTGDLATAPPPLAARRSARCDWIDRYGDPDGDGFVEYARRNERRPDPAGLEGLARLDLPRRRPAGRGTDRARARCRPMSMPRELARRELAARARRRASAARELHDAQADAAAGASSAPSGARSSAPMRWRSTATSGPAACASSNAGHVPVVAASPCPSGARRVAETAPAPTPCSPAGASARSRAGEARYNPMSYHNGSVWPHDNAHRRRGAGPLRPHTTQAARLLAGLFDASHALRPARGCRSCSAASPAATARARRATRSPARRRPGRPASVFMLLAGLPRPGGRRAGAPGPLPTIRACRTSWTPCRSPACGSATRRSTWRSGGRRWAWTCGSSGAAETSR